MKFNVSRQGKLNIGPRFRTPKNKSCKCLEFLLHFPISYYCSNLIARIKIYYKNYRKKNKKV